MTQPCISGLLEPERLMAPASLEGFDRIVKKLNADQKAIALLIDRYCRETGYPDVTGKELADWDGCSFDVLYVRPRFTDLKRLGWVERGPLRDSRTTNEARSHGVRLIVPMSAIQRIKEPK